MVRVVVVDDEPLVRAGLRLVLDPARGIEVVGEAGDGVTALRVVREVDPDVVLMDVRMPGGDGIEAVARSAPQACAAGSSC
ncbi:response regulator transcription factor [Nocardioides kongjuensis]|uniref:response regulator transcription factor n=1 Tax=Nocardioides kongjuensis TaxID=349522 RepID=UPI0031E8CE62